MANRTSTGAVTPQARQESGDANGKFPIFDHRSAMDALKLRNSATGVDPAAVVRRVQKWAKQHGDAGVLDAVEKITGGG